MFLYSPKRGPLGQRKDTLGGKTFGVVYFHLPGFLPVSIVHQDSLVPTHICSPLFSNRKWAILCKRKFISITSVYFQSIKEKPTILLLKIKNGKP